MASFTIPRAMTAVALWGVIALMSCRGDPGGVIAPGENPALATAPETGNTQAPRQKSTRSVPGSASWSTAS